MSDSQDVSPDAIASAPDFRFVPVPSHLAALKWLRHMYRHEYGRDRPLSLHLIGESGMGKSRVLRHYTEQFEGRERDTCGFRPQHILHVEAPADGDFRKLCERMLTRCLPGFTPARPSRYVERIGDVLQKAGVRQVLIDEAGNLLNAGRSTQQQTLATLKRLTNLGITLGIATTENMRNVLAADEQLHSRFRQVQLPRWNESEEFRALLAGLEAQLPFARRSYLDSQAVVRWLLSNRYATTGAVVDLVRDATLRVLACGGDVLALEALQEASVATLPPARNQGHA